MFCTYCGNEIEDDALFCTKCGRRVEEQAAGQSATPTEQTAAAAQTETIATEQAQTTAAGSAQAAQNAASSETAIVTPAVAVAPTQTEAAANTTDATQPQSTAETTDATAQSATPTSATNSAGSAQTTSKTTAPTEQAEAKTTDAAQSKIGGFNFHSWIAENGLEAYEDALRSQDCDTEAVLATLADGDLERIGISIGGRRKILIAIEKLKTPTNADAQANAQMQNVGAATATQSAAGEADTAQPAVSDDEHKKAIQSLQEEHEKAIKNLEESYGGLIQNLTKGKKSLKIVNIFGWILFAVFVVAAIYYRRECESIRSRAHIISDLYIEEMSSNEKLLAGLSSPVHVVINRVYNAANNSTNLIHEEITYLNFDYTVLKTSSVSNSDTLYVKILRPSGSLDTGTSSPSGYSFSVAMNSRSSGWGRATAGSAYRTSGDYTIEFWYKEVCVGRRVVPIGGSFVFGID